ncbi:hypothetical protein Tco_0856534 [Tanacetum coccineum]|uniref:No apical meristem-associated C-terminal domain-containing protein n=1 Tax=Tanacetum coccineum TaxID=301880 RepID=A0ABQ5B723_9ASTR
MYRPSFNLLYPSPQPNKGYSPLNRINLDMDMENLFGTQEYYMGQGSGGTQDYYTSQDYSMGHGSAKTTINKEASKPWTTAEDVALCKAWVDVSDNNIKGNAMKTRIHPRIGNFFVVYDNVKQRHESGSCDLIVYQKALQEYEQKSKTYGTTSHDTSDSAHGGLNLNEEVDDSEEEVREVRPIGRDQAKKKKATSSSSRSESSAVAGGGLVTLVADKWNLRTFELL